MNAFLLHAGGLATALLLLLTLPSCGGGETALTEPPVRPIRYATIESSDGVEKQSYTGVVNAGEQANLSFRVSGTLRQVKVKLGDRVNRGQLIASIDPADFDVQARQASAQAEGSTAQVANAETQLIATRATYRRIERLYENNSLSLSEFEQARSQFEAAQSSLAAAKAQASASAEQVAAARNQVSYTQLVAPFDGVITQLMAEGNEYFASGKSVAVLSSAGHPEVRVSVPEGLIGSIAPGDSVDVRLSALSQMRLRGSVSEVAFASGDSPSYPVVVQIADAPATLRPGMAASVGFSITEGEARERTLIAPVEAVAEGANGHYVFVLARNDSTGAATYAVQRRSIEIGKLYDEGFEIADGLTAGEYVATAGLGNLLDGMPVRLLGGDAAAPSAVAKSE